VGADRARTLGVSCPAGQGGGLVVAGGWTTYLLSGGMRGIWTKHRDWGAVGMGIPTAFFLGSLISQFAGKMWVAEELYHRSVVISRNPAASRAPSDRTDAFSTLHSQDA
jgi:hypothetical protein